jgi:NTE family protein
MALVTLRPPEHPHPDFPEPGPALCLSGGGFRAMAFHLGVLRRLNELGLLPELTRVASVSGGSITAGVLATRWKDLHFDPSTGVAGNFDLVEKPILAFARRRLDAKAILAGLALPRVQIGDRVQAAYEELFDGATLQDLPDQPWFVFCATNVATASLVRFSRPYVADSAVGKRANPRLPVSLAVTASSAFPPVLSPYRVELGDADALTETFDDDHGRPEIPEHHEKPFTHDLFLTDGGVYDNLGFQPIAEHAIVLVSDGGGPFKVQAHPRRNWAQHLLRTLVDTDHQVRSQRRIAIMSAFRRGERAGGFWAIDTDISRWNTQGRLQVDPGWIAHLSKVRTRLWPPYVRGLGLRPKVAVDLTERLVNWGYAICDATVRAKSSGTGPEPVWPFPKRALDRPPR